MQYEAGTETRVGKPRGEDTPDVAYDIQRAGNLKSMFFGGEGVFVATLSGSGTVWLQSLPFSRLADRVIASAPRSGGSSKGEGSVLGGSAACWMETGRGELPGCDNSRG